MEPRAVPTVAPTVKPNKSHATNPAQSLRKSLAPGLFLVATILALQLAAYSWPRRWIASGAPILTFFLLHGDNSGRRVLPFCHIWTLFATVNLAYAVASTSWLLYWVFTALCFPSIYITCLVQYKPVGVATRWLLRGLLKQLHFVDDKIALFDIPALEIDVDVDGLMVLRGITLSLSTLSFAVHGVEVGIKLSDDLELAIQTERVTVALFRSIEVDDCYANLKGGKQELTFGESRCKEKHHSRESSTAGDTSSMGATDRSSAKAKMTAGKPPKDSSNSAAYKAIKKQPLHSDIAVERYRHTLEQLDATNAISQAKKHLQRFPTSTEGVDSDDEPARRAAICSLLHATPSVPNPPQRSVKMTALRTLSSPRMRHFMHRLPLLLRMLLSPLSYFHPVTIRSITATASGDWLKSLLVQTIFRSHDSSEVELELERLQEAISSWVSDANFTVGLGTMAGQAHVPLLSSSSIYCQMAFDGVVAHRAALGQETTSVCEVVKLRGTDASFVVPTFLLPHHEHIIPDKSSPQVAADALRKGGADTDVEANNGGDETSDDNTAVKMAVRAHLPAKLDQDLLNFAALLVKHGKLLELDQAASPVEGDEKRLSDAVNQKMKDGIKKAVMGGDQWLAKLAGKVLKKLEVVNGDLGYSGDIPVDLAPYRSTGWLEVEGDKLLP
ncbi:hypothetical protein LLEC1_05993 [Akanthomyces lecanii]|uniref:Uncharacterized protein n=1 Tax=Cordyceps confragosa TaxID=2714763 RepID=A0A179IGU5_CORDF|nr:hypothetical protein LLEC1_05993 [Akanthomyces lecanii]